MARFYGWTHETIMNMNLEDFEMYYRCIDNLEAREVLENLKSTTFADRDKKPQENILKELNRLAFPIFDDEKPKSISTRSIFEKMKKAKNGRR